MSVGPWGWSRPRSESALTCTLPTPWCSGKATTDHRPRDLSGCSPGLTGSPPPHPTPLCSSLPSQDPYLLLLGTSNQLSEAQGGGSQGSKAGHRATWTSVLTLPLAALRAQGRWPPSCQPARWRWRGRAQSCCCADRQGGQCVCGKKTVPVRGIKFSVCVQMCRPRQPPS